MKRWYSYFAIFCISLLPFVSLFLTPLHPHTQDGLVHLARIGAFVKALKDGEFPIRWAGYLNYGYGMPLFDFMYPLPYFIASFFIFLGTNLVTSYKLVLATSFVLSGIFSFLFSRELFKESKRAWIFTVFYQFTQFRLVEILTRGDIGEIYAYTFLPLVCFGLVKISKKVTFVSFTLTSLATALLIVSHNSLSLSFFAVSLLFIFFLPFTKKSVTFSLGALGIGLLLSSFYWISALYDHKYTFGDLFMKSLYLQHFAPLQTFFIPNFLNNSSLRLGGVPIQVGFFSTLAILTAFWSFFRLKIDLQTKKVFVFSFILIIVSFFFMLPLSKPLWSHISLLRQFQFPWRLLGVVTFATALLSISFAELFNYRKFLILPFLIIVVLSTYWYWQPTYGWDKVDEKYYWNYPLTSTYYGETDVIWTQGQATGFPKSLIEFAAGKGMVKQIKKNSFMQTFSINAQTQSTLVDHTEYFPGWKVFVNNQQVPIQFQDQHYRGQITFSVPKGESFVKVVFGETPPRLFADILSLITLISLVFLYIWKGNLHGKKN